MSGVCDFSPDVGYHDIADNIMNKSKIRKLESILEGILKSPHSRSSSELRRYAGQVGRIMVNRGKEPTFERAIPPPLPALTIPGHPGDLAPGTVKNVVRQLLSDCDEWKLYLFEQEI